MGAARRRRTSWRSATALGVLAVALLPATAGAAPLRPGYGGISDTPSAVEPHWACPHGLCDAIADPRPAGGAALPAVYEGKKPEGGGKLGGYDPQDLRSAYAIPTSGGAGQTIAVVEGFVYKQAEKDLAEYRTQYGLPACTAKSRCLTIVNGKGQAPHFTSGTGWELEVALDLDMASAACPECHILLLDAEEETWDALGAATNRAATMGATEISNSYGLPEETCTSECAKDAADWNHPGIFVTVSAGDTGWDNAFEEAQSPSYPPTSRQSPPSAAPGCAEPRTRSAPGPRRSGANEAQASGRAAAARCWPSPPGSTTRAAPGAPRTTSRPSAPAPPPSRSTRAPKGAGKTSAERASARLCSPASRLTPRPTRARSRAARPSTSRAPCCSTSRAEATEAARPRPSTSATAPRAMTGPPATAHPTGRCCSNPERPAQPTIVKLRLRPAISSRPSWPSA